MTRPTLTLMLGIPGSGKSTIAAAEAQQTGAIIINPDEIRAELTGNAADQSQNRAVFALAEQRAAAALQVGQNVIIDATNIKPIWRQPWLDLAAQYGAAVELRPVYTPLALCLWRNWRRARRVPVRVILRMWRDLRRERQNLDSGDSKL